MLSVGYLILSRTYGMHLYTADLMRAVLDAGGAAHLVTVSGYPAHVYDPRAQAHAVWPSGGGALSARPLLRGGVQRVIAAVQQAQPDVVHITGPQLLNPLIMRRLRSLDIPIVHTLHDLVPHPGAVYGRGLHLWNRNVIARADCILVHGKLYRQRLLDRGVAPERVAHLPLLHPFLGHAAFLETAEASPEAAREPCALFFGRVARYKGVDVLLSAWSSLPGRPANWRLVIGGQGERAAEPVGPLPQGVERRNLLIGDAEALELFKRCCVVVLPYVGATQSALIPAAYYLSKPVIATRSGALPEYVLDGVTGWLIPENDHVALAQALQAALSDPERCRRMGAAGRVWYDTQREQERCGLLALYKRVCCGR